MLLDCLCIHVRLSSVILPALIRPSLCLLPVCSHLPEFFYEDYQPVGLFGSRSLWHVQRILWLPMRVCHVAFICESSPKKITCFTKLFLFPPRVLHPFRECWGLSQLYMGEGRINPWMNCQLRCRARLEHLGVPYLGSPPRVSWWWWWCVCGGGSFLLAHFPFFVYPGTWIRNPLLLSPVFYCLSCHSLNFN